VVESSGLLNRQGGLNLLRGFESPPLRHINKLYKIKKIPCILKEVSKLWHVMGHCDKMWPIASRVPPKSPPSFSGRQRRTTLSELWDRPVERELKL
jgi:hypothetical protein